MKVAAARREDLLAGLDRAAIARAATVLAAIAAETVANAVEIGETGVGTTAAVPRVPRKSSLKS